MTPRAPADACSVEVRKLGSTAVVISCPASEKKLATPTPPTPGVSHLSPARPGAAGPAGRSPLTAGSLPAGCGQGRFRAGG